MVFSQCLYGFILWVFFYFSKILKIKSFNSYYIIMYPPGGPVEVSGRGECPRPRTRPTASRFLSFSLSPFSLLPFLPPPLLQFSSLRIVLQNFHLPAINLLNARFFFSLFYGARFGPVSSSFEAGRAS